MELLTDRLRDLASQVREVAAQVFTDGLMRGATEGEVAAMVDAAAAILRPAEAVVIAGAGEIEARSDSAHPSERMTTRFGCRTPRDLLEQLTRVSGRRAGDYVTAGRVVQQPIAPTTGQVLPPRFPAMRAALAGGSVGVDAVTAVAGVLESALPIHSEREAADAELAAAARGEGADGAPPATADELRMQAHVWAMYLNQDGAEPRDRHAARGRGLTLGVCRDGLVPVRGSLLPDVAGQVQLLFASILNPKLDGPRFSDTDGIEAGADAPSDEAWGADMRTPAQKRHDAFATIVGVAARTGELPTIGGAAPTLVVSATAEDLRNNTGFAHIDGCEEPVSIGVARHTACIGAVQRVCQNDRGRILSIEIADRVFNAHQRRSIALRDGSCLIPGCRVPAAWCEIHHVQEAARGGPTHTDNGVLLCWHHHRTLDTNGWQIRLVDGVPEIRAPLWREPYLQWRPVTRSPITQRRRHARRAERE